MKKTEYIKGDYWIELPAKEYTELVERAARTNMPIKEWRMEMAGLAQIALDKKKAAIERLNT